MKFSFPSGRETGAFRYPSLGTFFPLPSFLFVAFLSRSPSDFD